MMTTIEWLTERKTGIGGSDLAAIMGISPYATALDIYNDKLGIAPDREENDDMRAGKLLEKFIAQEYERRHSVTLEIGGFERDTIHPFILGTPDFVDTVNDCVIECKAPRSWTFKSWGNEIPPYYWVQMQHYMYLKRRTNAVLVVLTDDGRTYKEFHVVFDQEWYRGAIKAMTEFWYNNILAMNPPPPSVLPADPELPAVAASVEVSRAVKDLSECKELERLLKERKTKSEAIVREAFGHAVMLKDGDNIIATYKEQTDQRIDSDALRKALPDIAAQFTKTTTKRVLKIK